ncbi:thioredoxin-like protein [Schizophyllum amplum]|uniref:Thioredoxin-like protein n=1 Tax=Schizophyllum amplum TaxID=97359 RepID=A0A550CCQ5_9AGAR|nr:thioredoxin-like protein [Auriculariopsis ampla]
MSLNVLRQSVSTQLAQGSRRSFASTALRAKHYPNADQKVYNDMSGESFKDRIVLVDFYADWCRPCHMLSPVLEKSTAEGQLSGTSKLPLDLVQFDTDSEFGMQLGQQFSIRSLPTVMAFRNGKPIPGAQFVGALNEAGVSNFIKQL